MFGGEWRIGRDTHPQVRKQGCDAMNREQKLALIVGFALVLVVGVLISDQLSAARRSVDPASGTPGTLQAALEPPADDLGPAFGREFEKRDPIQSRTPAPDSTVLVLTNGSEGLGLPSESTTLADAASKTLEQMGDLFVQAQNGNSPAMQVDGVPSFDMGKPLATESAPSEKTILTSEIVEPAPSDSAVTTVPMRPEKADADVRPVRTHRVQEDETLWSIAKKYYGDGSLANALATYNANRIGKGGVIQVGASLLIPDAEVLGGTSKAKPSTTTKVASAEKPAPKASDKSTAKKPEPAKKSTASIPKTYTVKSGDTLQKISDKFYGTTKRWNDILELNEKVIDDEDGLQVGMVIKLPQR